MNLAFNAVMWGLFTRALTLASSTVRVSVINTSANFMLTAVLGAIIFSESLPGRFCLYFTTSGSHPNQALSGVWWLGAAFLIAGSVIIGRREEGKDVGSAGTGGAEAAVAGQAAEFQDEPDAPPAPAEGLMNDSTEAYKDSIELERKPKKKTNGDGDEHIE